MTSSATQLTLFSRRLDQDMVSRRGVMLKRKLDRDFAKHDRKEKIPNKKKIRHLEVSSGEDSDLDNPGLPNQRQEKAQPRTDQHCQRPQSSTPHTQTHTDRSTSQRTPHRPQQQAAIGSAGPAPDPLRAPIQPTQGQSHRGHCVFACVFVCVCRVFVDQSEKLLSYCTLFFSLYL